MIVREDLPKGFLAAHVAHAAGESGPAPPGSIAVVLGHTAGRRWFDPISLHVRMIRSLLFTLCVKIATWKQPPVDPP